MDKSFEKIDVYSFQQPPAFWENFDPSLHLTIDNQDSKEDGSHKQIDNAVTVGELWAKEFEKFAASQQQPARAKGQKKPMEKAKRIDVTSRFIFPAIFASFNIVYWTHYLSQAQLEYEANVLSMKK